MAVQAAGSAAMAARRFPLEAMQRAASRPG